MTAKLSTSLPPQSHPSTTVNRWNAAKHRWDQLHTGPTHAGVDLPNDAGQRYMEQTSWEGIEAAAAPAKPVYDFCFYGGGVHLGTTPGTRKTWFLKPANATPAEVQRMQDFLGPDGLVCLDEAEYGAPGYTHWSDPASLAWWIDVLTPIQGKVGLYGIPVNGAMGIYDDAWRANNDKYDSQLVKLVEAIMPSCYFKYTLAEWPPDRYSAFVRDMTVEAVRLRDKFNPAAKVIPVLSPRIHKIDEFIDLANWTACIAECRAADGVLIWDDGPSELRTLAEPLIAAAVEGMK